MSYPKIGVFRRFGPFADTIAGRDAFIGLWASAMADAQWTPRALGSYFDVLVDTTVKPVSAEVFLNCPTANDGNWAIFDNNTNRKVYIIDRFVPPEESPFKMACLVPGAFDGTYTSVGYIENGDTNMQLSSVIAALGMLGYSAGVIAGTTTLRVKSQGVSNGNSTVTFGSNTKCSSPQNGRLLNGGYVMRCRANTAVGFKNGGLSTYGVYNDQEMLMFQNTRGFPSPVLKLAFARRFSEFPDDMPGQATTGLYNGSDDEPNGPDGASRYHWGSDGGGNTGYSVVRVDTEYVVYANPFVSMGWNNTENATDRSAYYVFALNLLGGMRYLDTQDFPWDRALGAFSTSGSETGGFGRQGWMGSAGRVELKSPYGYWKIRMKAGSSNPFSGLCQMYSDVPGRGLGTEGVIVGDGAGRVFRPCNEPWIGWGMSGDGAGVNAIIPGQLPGFLVLHEQTPDPINSPTFFNDGRNWKRLTKQSVVVDKSSAFTLCGIVGTYNA